MNKIQNELREAFTLHDDNGSQYKHELLRKAHDLINAIEGSSAEIHTADTVVKTETREGKTPYVNRQRIRRILEQKFHQKYPNWIPDGVQPMVSKRSKRS